MSDWLIENFPITEKEDLKTEHKVVLTTQNNKSSPTKKDTINSTRLSKLIVTNKLDTVNTPKVKNNNFNSFNEKKIEEKKSLIKNHKTTKNAKNASISNNAKK